MGPFAASDLAGLDVGWRARKARGATSPVADALCEAGRFGQKTNAGYYHYEPGSRAPLPDPEVERIIVAASARLGIARRKIAAAEMLDRVLLPMVNEGARILEEGIALRPGDIDVIWVYGYGWPVHRGGPMFHADSIGLADVGARLAEQARRLDDPSLAPAPLLARLAAAGRGFAALARAQRLTAAPRQRTSAGRTRRSQDRRRRLAGCGCAAPLAPRRSRADRDDAVRTRAAAASAVATSRLFASRIRFMRVAKISRSRRASASAMASGGREPARGDGLAPIGPRDPGRRARAPERTCVS